MCIRDSEGTVPQIRISELFDLAKVTNLKNLSKNSGKRLIYIKKFKEFDKSYKKCKKSLRNRKKFLAPAGNRTRVACTRYHLSVRRLRWYRVTRAGDAGSIPSQGKNFFFCFRGFFHIFYDFFQIRRIFLCKYISLFSEFCDDFSKITTFTKSKSSLIQIWGLVP